MKSLAELQAIKDRMKSKIVLREGAGEIRVVKTLLVKSYPYITANSFCPLKAAA